MKGENMNRKGATILINVVVWIPIAVLLAVGLWISPIPSEAFGATSGWLSAGLFSMGVVSAGLFSIGIYSAGLFSIGIFSAGVFSIGIFSFGTFVIGIWAAGQFAKGRFLGKLKKTESKE
jgi:hypothetical protein